MLPAFTKRWIDRLPAGPAVPAPNGRRNRRRKAYLTVDQLEERCCPAPVFPGDIITGVATLHSTDANETGENEPAVLTNTTGSFKLTVSNYEVPTPFQFKAAVVNDNVAFRISGEDADESVDVQIQINGKNALTINQKQALTDTGNNVNIGSNVLWVIAGGCGLGAIFFTGGTALPLCAGIASVAAGGTGGYGSSLQKQASDPPDSHFNAIAQAKTPKAPHIKSGHGISVKVANALNAFVQNEVKGIGVLAALTTTENRVSGAALANNQRGVNRQLKVARKFRHQLAGLLVKDVSLRIRASAALKSGGITFPTLTPDQVFSFEQSLASNGPPASVLATLHALKVDDQTIKQLTSQFVVQDTHAVAKVSHDPFADPSILASLRAAAAALRVG